MDHTYHNYRSCCPSWIYPRISDSSQESHIQKVRNIFYGVSYLLSCCDAFVMWQDAGKEAELLAEIARLKASLQEKDSELEQLRTKLAQYEHWTFHRLPLWTSPVWFRQEVIIKNYVLIIRRLLVVHKSLDFDFSAVFEFALTDLHHRSAPLWAVTV